MPNTGGAKVMTVTRQVIDAAFEMHYRKHAARTRRAWPIRNHVECWQRAHRAFSNESFDDFVWLYEELRRYWQLFRRSEAHWSADEAYEVLTGLNAACRHKRLSEVRAQDALPIRAALEAMAGVKTTSSGPSIMAISKFLHFWNPRLFVIVDTARMWDGVFSHSWIWEQVSGSPKRGPCNTESYVTILLWAARLARANPSITAAFAQYVSGDSGGCELPSDLKEYDAAAVEWFLLGLVELPPAGVSW